jgi:predicted nucleotidyltransferase
MTLDELVGQLKAAYGTTLRSVILYGSAVAGEHLGKRSDYNVLCVLDAVPRDRLAAVGAVLRAWGEAGNPAPMTFTSSEWKSSADVFPMEYADILERHQVLHGEDVTREVSVSRGDLRLQVEQQALGKLLHLRRGAMAAGDDGNEQLKLLEASMSAIMVVFRGVIRLDGGVPSLDYAELSAEVARRAGFDAEPFRKAVAHVRGTARIARDDAGKVLAGYMAGMEALTAWIDGFAA